MRLHSARTEGMGAGARGGASPTGVMIGALLAVGVAVAAFGAWALVPLAAVAIATALAAWWLASRFGGLTGDCYGAIIELAEVAALLAMSAVFANSAAAAFPWGGRA
jgi:adenosylcobinamide-GDP ribazoletransferase